MKKQDEEKDTTRNITDAEGNCYNFDEVSRVINYRVDKHGFIYNSKNERTGNVHGHEFIDGFYYD